MKIYWSADSMPALANLPPKQRQKILKTCTRKYAFRHWQTWISFLILAVIVVVVGRYTGMFGLVTTAGIGYGMITAVVNTAIYPDIKKYVERELKQ
ncbi:MAG: hypothetical protein HC769_01950 [Cyanobacteria bacterium CRU_2_1]|nr:hypothetical protein [Cyanobacteria bacterium RU_5_0]NJR57720.1 hypothetical protein [Cyanobacteria bacterium CRU_2_1]